MVCRSYQSGTVSITMYHPQWLSLSRRSVVYGSFHPRSLRYLSVTTKDCLYSRVIRDLTPYDVILGTIMACGKAGILYALAGLSTLGCEKDLMKDSWISSQEEPTITPDNAEKLYPRMVKLVLRLIGEPSPPVYVQGYPSYQDDVASLPRAFSRHIRHYVWFTQRKNQ